MELPSRHTPGSRSCRLRHGLLLAPVTMHYTGASQHSMMAERNRRMTVEGSFSIVL